jgi:uncharacterized DUF497 family protein
MNFVDENHGAAPGRLKLAARIRHRLTQICDARTDRAYLDKLGIELFREQQRNRGFARTGRSPQNHRMKPARRDHLGEQLAGAEQMLLTDHLLEAGGPDAIGKRLRGRLLLREEAPGCDFAPHPSTLSYEVRAASSAVLPIRELRMLFHAPEFEWDETKSARNRADRGFGFDYASWIFENEVLVTEDRRRDYGEERFRVTGKVDEVFITVAFTFRGDGIRIISARIAKRKERDGYREAFPARDS